MQKSHSTINKFALVLLSLVVLELILIGDQVAPVKAIKKKMYLKKLKKLLPILALVKPKKKIILLPIPIPMMHHGGNQTPRRPTIPNRPYLPHAPMPASGAPPISFIMMTQPGQVPPDTLSMAMMEGNMMEPDKETKPQSQDEHLQNLKQREPTVSMVMPSMTMTIQSEGGAHSAIELSTNLMGATQKNHSDPVFHLPMNQWSQQPIQQQKQEFGMLKQVQPVRPPYPPQHTYSDNFGTIYSGVGGGEPYYSSPWASAKPPLASPMKLLRKDRLRDHPTTPKTPTTSSSNSYSYNQGFAPQEQIELDDITVVGPPQLRPFLQDSSGHLQMQPSNLISAGSPNNWRPTTGEVDESDEVRTIANEPPVRPRLPLESGKNRQAKGHNLQQQQQTKNFQHQNVKPLALNP